MLLVVQQACALNAGVYERSPVHELAFKYAPVVVFHPDEQYFPSSVDWLMERAMLHDYAGRRLGFFDKQRLNEVDQRPYGKDVYRYYFDIPKRDYGGMLLKEDKDAKMRTRYLSPATCYVYVFKNERQNYVIRYLFFYPFNGPLSVTGPLGRPLKIGIHEGDWEHIDVILNQSDQIETVFYARHGKRDGRHYRPQDIKFSGQTHPIVYSALYGHASYARANEPNPFYDHTADSNTMWFTMFHLEFVDEKNTPWFFKPIQWGSTVPKKVAGIKIHGASPISPPFASWWLQNLKAPGKVDALMSQ